MKSTWEKTKAKLKKANYEDAVSIVQSTYKKLKVPLLCHMEVLQKTSYGKKFYLHIKNTSLNNMRYWQWINFIMFINTVRCEEHALEHKVYTLLVDINNDKYSVFSDFVSEYCSEIQKVSKAPDIIIYTDETWKFLSYDDCLSSLTQIEHNVSKDALECVVCLQDFFTGIHPYDCTHFLCVDCANAIGSRVCPLCRSKTTQINGDYSKLEEISNKIIDLLTH